MLSKLVSMTTIVFAFALSGCGEETASKGGELRITASAEGLGANGYLFPPGVGQEVAFVDGWELTFERILAVVGNIRLSETPDKNPGDQGKTGPLTVERKGSYVLDLKGGGTDLDKGGAGKVAIRLPIDDLEDLFDLEQRYAFGYDLVAATADATPVNVEMDDPDLASMITAQQRLLFVGVAHFRGTDCTSSDSSYDFSRMPQTVRFRFGFTGAVRYANCQNPDNTGSAIDGEESQRGIQMLPHTATVAQITIHTDHLFWPTTAHENLPMFNQFAVNASPVEGGDATPVVTLDDLASVPIPSLTDREGKPFPWRSCVPSSLYVLPTQPPTVTFDSSSQPISNLRDFVEFNARTMGHLNADGLCYVSR